MERLTWTETEPTQPGLYWLRGREWPRYGQAPTTILWTELTVGPLPSPVGGPWQYAGPIPEPVEPEPAEPELEALYHRACALLDTIDAMERGEDQT